MITTETRLWTEKDGWSEASGNLASPAQLVFVFGARKLLTDPKRFKELKDFYPDARLISGSTSGNILNASLTEDAITVSALHFEKTQLWFIETEIKDQSDSKNIGKKLAEVLPRENLVHSIVLSDGLDTNGSALVSGINENLPVDVTVTGGLVGDGIEFRETLVGSEGVPHANRVVFIGFYSQDLKVGYASGGGWQSRGEALTITRSDGNILYELNGRPALDVYLELLDVPLEELTKTALRFPLQMELPNEGVVVRTVLSIDAAEKALIFAGDVPEGLVAHMMEATNNDLIASARQVAKESAEALLPDKPQFALLVSCVGRKEVLGEQTEKELQAVQEVFGSDVTTHGFYSYGELCPQKHDDRNCLMHNQTMTITTFTEQ